LELKRGQKVKAVGKRISSDKDPGPGASKRGRSLEIFYITMGDGVFLPLFFDRILSGNGNEVAGIAVVRDPHMTRFLRRSLRFMGIWLFAGEVFRQLKIRLMDLLYRVFAQSKRSSIQSVCRKYNIPCYPVENVNSKSFHQVLKEKKINLLVSVACPQILKKKLLDIPSLGCINIHYGLLPHYRGMYPSFWVLANNEKETGVSVHYMVEKIDAGDILVQIKENIRPDDTFYSLVKRLKTTIGPTALSQAIEKIRDGNIPVIPNDPRKGSYLAFPARKDMDRFRALGRKWR
jgi:methionyl-tRNA formyltransferase